MVAAGLKHGLWRIGGWCALAGASVLLTLLFSFLGNLSCAVIAGLILGSARQWRWSAIPISLVCPAVILALSYYSKVDLPPAKIQLVALLSGLAFWGVVGMTRTLRFLERKPEPPPVSPGENADVPAANPGSPAPVLDMAMLCGSWTCDEPGATGPRKSRKLHIEPGRFVLTESNARGRERVVARGEVQTQPEKIVFTAQPPSGEGGPAGGPEPRHGR